jgi:hypothetical protein
MLKLLCLPIVAFILLFPEDRKDILVWDQNRLLNWDDFRGKPQKRFAAASTHYDMYKTTEQKGKEVEVKVEAVFLCDKSWKKMSWCSQSVLDHEQKHFDIDELYARKLRKLIKEQKYSSYEEVKTISDSLYNVIDKEMDIYQDKYDDETDGSMNGEKQREWQKKIDKEIADLSSHKNTTFWVLLSK